MTDVVGLVLPFFGLILIGVAAARLVGLPDAALGWMNVFVLYIALPALFFQLLSQTPIEQLTEWTYIAGAVLATYIVFGLMFAGSCILSGGSIAEHAVKSLAASYGNIGYMGPAIALLALGQDAAVPVALIICFENMVHFTVLPFLMAIDGRTGGSLARTAKDAAQKVLLHPFIIASALGIAAAAYRFDSPLPLERMLGTLAEAAAPCALFAMGVTLGLRPLRRAPAALVPITLLKLLVHPLLCYLVLSLIGDFAPVWVWSAVLLAALPSATNVYVIAQQYGVWVERSSAAILVTTVVSVATVTLTLYLISGSHIPADLFPG